jgi:indole-3-acetate monooxygenase
MMAPTSLGGDQVDSLVALEVAEEFSRQDGSVGWVATFGFIGPIFGDYLSEHVQREIYGKHDAFVGGSLAPTGHADLVPGGFRVTGRWAFGSGCQNAAWLVGGALVMRDGVPFVGPDGISERKLVIMPASDVRIHDTWSTAGMRGTGSHDFEVENVFVPEERVFPFSNFLTGPAERPGIGYGRGFFEVVTPFLSAIALGIGRNAIETLISLARGKVSRGGAGTLAEQSTTHERVGRADALLNAARAYLFDAVTEIQKDRGEPMRRLMRVRQASAFAAQSAAEVVNMMYDLGGGSAIYTSSPLERCFRDVNTITHHFLLTPAAFVTSGHSILDPEWTPALA